jgi:hypothetical protein
MREGIPRMYQGIYNRAMSGKSRKAAMHAFCLECVCWERNEVALCTDKDCPLFPYRPYKRVKNDSDARQNLVACL